MSPEVAGQVASELGLELRENACAGRVGGRRVSVDAPEAALAHLRVVVKHARPLRLGMLAWTGPSALDAGWSEPCGADEIGDAHLDTFLRLYTPEPKVASAILVAAKQELGALEHSHLRIDDRAITVLLWGLAFESSVRQAVLQTRRMVALTDRLSRERAEWEATYETRIEPLWSKLAREGALEWNPDRSRIRGELGGAAVEVKVVGDVGRLDTRVRAKWPRLEQLPRIEWEARRFGPMPVPARVYEDESLPAPALHATRVVRSSGASLALHEEGLEAWIDGPCTRREEMERLFLGLRLLTSALLTPISGAASIADARADRLCGTRG